MKRFAIVLGTAAVLALLAGCAPGYYSGAYYGGTYAGSRYNAYGNYRYRQPYGREYWGIYRNDHNNRNRDRDDNGRYNYRR